MRIVVIGASGLIGAKLVPQLSAAGHVVTATSHATGVNTLTGQGLPEAMAGAEVAIDLTNAPASTPGDALEFFQTSTTNIVSAAEAAGVQHYVVLSAVGCDRMPDAAYMQAKTTQESLIRQSGLRHSIVRATPFFELAPGLADASTIDGQVHVSPAGVQPIAGADVADAVAQTAVGAPIDGVVEHAGPEALTFDGWLRTFLSAAGDPRQIVADSSARMFGAIPGDDVFLPGSGAILGPTTLSAWLAARN